MNFLKINLIILFLLIKEKFSPNCFDKLSFKIINSGDLTGIGDVLEIKGSGSFE